MSDLPSHPDSGSPSQFDPSVSDPQIAPGSRRRSVLAVAGVAALVVLVVVLHLTGVLGAGSH